MKKVDLGRLVRWCAAPTREYGAVVGLFLIVLVAAKSVELAALMGRTEVEQIFDLLARAVAYNMTIVCWVVLAVWPLHLAVYRLAPKVSHTAAPLFFAVWLLAEIGLTLYCIHNGFLLSGGELLMRPLSESVQAVVGIAGPVWPIAGIAAWLALFFVAAQKLMCRPWRSHWISLAVLGVMLLLSILLHPENMRISRYDDYIVNKTHRLCLEMVECWQAAESDNRKNAQKEAAMYDEAMTDAFLSIHPAYHPQDKRYPLERPDATPDNLSHFFAASTRSPHVVLVVVESMGEECLRTGIMPFVDSLAQHSLYWANCLSTTPRSYGALPALTGSVGGPCGFQFGQMPDHNSLISILGKAGYRTGAYYAGYFSFDGVYDYLNMQHIDYLSPFFDEYRQHGSDEAQGNSWGYHDGPMLVRTIEEISRCAEQPRFDLVVTLTMHEPLALADSKAQSGYLDRVGQRARSLPPTDGKWVKDNGRFCAAALYTDDALRQFVQQYLQLPGGENTLFVITGDHASGRCGNAPLSNHHVPLIIWSPLLKESHQFPAVVTHNDVAPSLCRLLGSRYGVKVPAMVHWLGPGLVVSDQEGCDRRMLIVNYANEMHEMLCGQCFYREASRGKPEALYAVGPGLTMREVTDKEACARCRAELRAYQYIYRYTYQANRLTKHPLYPSRYYKLIRQYEIPGVLACTAPGRNGNEIGIDMQSILPDTTIRRSAGFEVVRMTILSDLRVNRESNIRSYPAFIVAGKGDDEIWENINPVKYVQSDRINPGQDYHVEIEKEYLLTKADAMRLGVVIASPVTDCDYLPGVGLELRNTCVRLEYGR